jgi:hypothetical protein
MVKKKRFLSMCSILKHMGNYYGVEAIVNMATPVGPMQMSGPLSSSYPWTNMNERLIGIAQNGVTAIAVDLTNRDDYKRWEENTWDGPWKGIDLFRIDKDRLDECPDQGHMSVQDYVRLIQPYVEDGSLEFSAAVRR